MDLAAFAIQDKFEKEALDNASAPLSCGKQWSNRIELLNKLNMRELLPMDASYSTTNNIDLHSLQDGDVQYPFGVWLEDPRDLTSYLRIDWYFFC